MVALLHIREWLPNYSFEKDFAFDCISGVTVGMMAIPQSISYASIAGLPAQYGLYSDLQIMYPIFGTSKYLVVGPVAVMSLMARVALERIDGLQEFSPEWIKLACFLSLLVSLLQLGLATLGLGTTISRLFPETVISGFASAAAMIIASTQFPGLLGLQKCSSSSDGSCSFPVSVLHVLANIPNCQISAVLCSAICLVLLFSFKAKKFGSGIISNFGPLTVVTFSIIYVRLSEYIWGKNSVSLAQVGAIPAGLPPVQIGSFHIFPSSIDQSSLLQLLLSCVPIALIGFTEAITIAKTSAKVCDGDVNSVHENNEMFALAACNAFTSWVSICEQVRKEVIPFN
uniref:SLC26A/SulP transporter domain-containing protein n=1 Tax=Aplanochytrium stocchinoi TaxID=215587 RepID=A0A7S3LTF4_9STRA